MFDNISLSCPFNYTRICWCTIETSSDLLRSSSAIFVNLRYYSGNVRNCSENVLKRSSGLRNNFGKSSEILGKWSEIFGKSKTASAARLHKTLARRYEFHVLVVRLLVRYSSCHSNVKFISSRPRVIAELRWPEGPPSGAP